MVAAADTASAQPTVRLVDVQIAREQNAPKEAGVEMILSMTADEVRRKCQGVEGTLGKAKTGEADIEIARIMMLTAQLDSATLMQRMVVAGVLTDGPGKAALEHLKNMAAVTSLFDAYDQALASRYLEECSAAADALAPEALSPEDGLDGEL